VAPIFEEGRTARQVYLPEGTWHHWHTGDKFAGRGYVIAQAPMDFIPLYARGGAVIPAWPEVPRSTMGYHPEEVELHVFVPDADGETRSMLHEDDGLTFASRDGAFYRTEFVLGKMGRHLTLTASVSGNGYPEFARKRFLVRLHGADVRAITVDGAPVSVADGVVVLENAGRNFCLEAEIA
jgi:alpha-glucosidase